MKYYQQYDYSDCGAACIAMISSFYGKNISIANTRNYCGVSVGRK